MVLAGTAPELAAHYPSVGGDGDAAAAWWHLRDLFERRPPEVLDALTRPPQTNEVGRSAVARAGLPDRRAQQTGLPLRLLELGASAGLNLRADRYWYEQDGCGWGDPGSPCASSTSGPMRTPPLDVDGVIASRAGCDRDPIDAADPEAALTLLSYVWPDQAERLARLRAALAIAAESPVDVVQATIEEWLPEQLATPVAGRRDGRVPLRRLAVPARTDAGARPRHARRGRRAGRRRRTRRSPTSGWSRRRRPTSRRSSGSRPGPAPTRPRRQRCSRPAASTSVPSPGSAEPQVGSDASSSSSAVIARGTARS